MSKLLKSILLITFLLSLGPFCAFAVDEELTIATYYPSPYGSYNSLQSNMLGVGDYNGDGNFNSADVPTTSGNIWSAGNVTIKAGSSLCLGGLLVGGSHNYICRNAWPSFVQFTFSSGPYHVLWPGAAATVTDPSSFLTSTLYVYPVSKWDGPPPDVYEYNTPQDVLQARVTCPAHYTAISGGTSCGHDGGGASTDFNFLVTAIPYTDGSGNSSWIGRCKAESGNATFIDQAWVLCSRNLIHYEE